MIVIAARGRQCGHASGREVAGIGPLGRKKKEKWGPARAAMEGKRRKPLSSSSREYRIPKKKPHGESKDVQPQSPLTRLRSWDHVFQGWQKEVRNKNPSTPWRRKRDFSGCVFPSERSPDRRQPKVILRNVLRTELGRQYLKTLPRADANLSDADELQSELPLSSSVDRVERDRTLNPLHQNLYLSERQPRIVLMNILRTEVGRKCIKAVPIADPNLADTTNLQSDQLPSSPVDSLETCQKQSSPHQSPFVSKRRAQCQNIPSDGLAEPAELPKEKSANDDICLVQECDLQPKGVTDYEPQKRSENQDEAALSVTLEKTMMPSSHFLAHVNAATLEKSVVETKKQESDAAPSPGCSDPGADVLRPEPALLPEYTPQPAEADFTQPSSLESLELALNSARKSYYDCFATSPFQKRSWVPSDSEGVPRPLGTAGQLKTKGGLCLRKLHARPGEGKQLLVSVEPIVVSSDEEGSAEQRSSEKLSLQPEQARQDVSSEAEKLPESSLSEPPPQDVILCKLGQISPGRSSQSPDEGNASSEASANVMEPVLEIEFSSVYIGKIKGTSSGCVKFTTKTVHIPFQVDPNKPVSLSVDTIHLRKFGLWKTVDDARCRKINAVIFLWATSDYVEEVETQLGCRVLSQPLKSNEFIFLELQKPISEAEEVKLNEVVAEVSKKNRSADLSEPLLWSEALPLIQDFPLEECSFLHHLYSSFQPRREEDGALRNAPPLPQVSTTNATKPNYTLLQKQRSGFYSLSMTAKSDDDDEWIEVKKTGPIQKLIVYPPPPTKGGLGVTNEDLECLEDGEFLNDVIIDFYLKYLLLEKAPEELVERCHIFSSFFYKCLTRKEKNATAENSQLSLAQRRHKRVRTWTRHINIFNKDYIFVPVNEESHWYLAVICFPWLEEAVFEECPKQPLQPDCLKIDHGCCSTSQLSTGSEDTQSTMKNKSEAKSHCKRPCILILDSLKASSVQNTVHILREYLEVEWEVKWKTHREFNKSTMVDFCPKVPKQDNSSDCGLYLLQYVESFFKDPVVNFELPMHLERWFPRQVVRTKREEIRELILKLRFQQQKGSGS
ncbi:sentrin-specific protease 7 [Tachyglossus aculeatus]|uniref:sentrin-specific protease 7 n=1 Tax=Tachyglossus aculeatus TaxID=9261 RepID=UPI0018F4EDFA|nr:sentrin-specific protease 7 [Tachyglossus aculeatus]